MSNLPDFGPIVADTKEKLSKIDLMQSVSLSPSSWAKITSAMGEKLKSPSSAYQVGGHTLIVKNRDKQLAFISAEEIPILLQLYDYRMALQEYSDAADSIAREMGFSSRTDKKANPIFGQLPSFDLSASLSAEDKAKLTAAFAVLPSSLDQEYMKRFVSKPEWAGMINANGDVTKKLSRNEWIESAVLNLGGLIAAGAVYRIKLIEVLKETGIQESDLQISGHETASEAPTSAVVGENRLYFGAPGTGKSRSVNERIGSTEPIRTVFHSDMQNSDFIGSLKPMMIAGHEGEADKVSYSFSPGPFANALLKSLLNTADEVFLVIEELNRAPAAAVFGDLFLLLDRTKKGASEYWVDFPSEEFRTWLQKETGSEFDKLRLPANLSILATMNSADQGVFPIDSAFRRRWRHTYLPIDFGAEGVPDGTIEVVRTGLGPVPVTWSKFGLKLNERLTKLEISEDRLLGAWFVSPEELKASTKTPEKLLTYLWDDLLRHGAKGEIFDTDNMSTYGELSKNVEESKQIFHDDFLTELGVTVGA